MSHPAIGEIKKAIVFIGHDQNTGKRILKQTDSFTGTGFLLNIENFFYICTAKHVIDELRKGGLAPNDPRQWAAIGTKDQTYKKVYFDEIKSKYKIGWLTHKSKKYDVALLPIELNQESQDYKLISQELFLKQEIQNKPEDLTRVFICSFQPDLERVKEINPIVRVGFVSRSNKDNTILIDAHAYPGNSGSPVFVAPEVGRLEEQGFNLGDPYAFKFVGLVSSYVPYQDVAISNQTGQAKIAFTENSGLATVQTCKVIEEIISSKRFKDQINSLNHQVNNGTN